MTLFRRVVGVVVLAGLVLVGPWAAEADAQRMAVVPHVLQQGGINPNFLLPNGMSLNQFAFNTAVLGQALANVPPYALGYNPYTPAVANYGLGATGGYGPYASLVTNGYSGMGYGGAGYPGMGYGGSGYSGGYGGYGYMDPNYGYLKGAAEVTQANANYDKTLQEARLLRDKSYRAALETRRSLQDEAAYERLEWLKRIDPEANRRKEVQQALDRARNDPPLTEVLSGRALNDLLEHAFRQQGKGERGPNVPLSEDLLKGVNVTGQDTRGNVGLLKADGKLDWPGSLDGPEFAESRRRLGTLLADAVAVAKYNNPVETGKLKDMHAELARLHEALQDDVGNLSPSQYIEANRYLKLLDDAVKALEDPKVSNYFNQNWGAKGKNVAELIKYMSDRGLRFAPAVPGDADAYRALYQALVAFDAGASVVKASAGSYP
jgi:hypothetical protein